MKFMLFCPPTLPATLAERGAAALFYRRFNRIYGFWEAFRLPGDDEKFPLAKGGLPRSEWTVERTVNAHYVFAGTVDDVRREMDTVVDAVNPEWFAWWSDQGGVPLYQVKKQLELFGTKILPQYK